jgi:hypothetical protein
MTIPSVNSEVIVESFGGAPLFLFFKTYSSEAFYSGSISYEADG